MATPQPWRHSWRGAALEAEAKDGWRALHYAARDGRTSIVETLLAAGAALEAETKDGWRAIQLADHYGYSSTFQAVRAAGALLYR